MLPRIIYIIKILLWYFNYLYKQISTLLMHYDIPSNDILIQYDIRHFWFAYQYLN